MIYFVVLFLLIVLSYQYDILRKVDNKEFWYHLILFLLVLIAGLRYRLGGDTLNYITAFYHEIPTLDRIDWENMFVSEFEPLFVLLNSTVKTLGGRFYVVQLIHALFVNGLILTYFKKHSEYPFTCALLFFVWSYFLFNFEEMRASMSVAICLYANDYIIDKKIVRGLLLYLIASLLHYSSLILIITPLLLFLRLNSVGIGIMVILLVLGALVKSQVENYLSLLDFLDDRFSGRALNYVQKEEYSGSHNIFYYLIDVGGYVFYSILSVKLLREFNDSNSIRRLEPLVVIGLLFVILKSNIGILYRYVRFYEPYFILFFTYAFFALIRKTKNISVSVSIVRSLIIYLPFLYIIASYYKGQIKESLDVEEHYNYEKYYPYASIIERSVDEEREKLFHSIGVDNFKMDEY